MLKKIMITLLEIALIVIVIYSLITITNSIGIGEELTEVWVMCQPNDYVNVRANPNRRSEAVGYAEAGYMVITDGKLQHGFLRIYGIGEMGVGWIHAGYVVYDEPHEMNVTARVNSNGRVKARQYIGGKRREWLKNKDEVKVYWLSDEWCVTNKGFVKTEYLEMEGT